jgi:hypothetical protein
MCNSCGNTSFSLVLEPRNGMQAEPGSKDLKIGTWASVRHCECQLPPMMTPHYRPWKEPRDGEAAIEGPAA